MTSLGFPKWYDVILGYIIPVYGNFKIIFEIKNMGDILTYSFDAYLLVTAWNSGLDEEKERRILQVTALGREAIDSMELFQGLMVF